MRFFSFILSVTFGISLASIYFFGIVFPQLRDGYEEDHRLNDEYQINLKEAQLIINSNLESCEANINPLQVKLKMKKSNYPRYWLNPKEHVWMISSGGGFSKVP